MTTLLIMSACGLLALGLYHLSCAIVDVPTPKTSKMMLLAKKQTGIGKENLFDVYLTKIAERFSPLLKLDPIKRGKLALTLSIAGIYLSPETYTLKALFTSLIVATRLSTSLKNERNLSKPSFPGSASVSGRVLPPTGMF